MATERLPQLASKIEASPALEKEIKEKLKITNFGNITIASAPCGKRETQQQIIAKGLQHPSSAGIKYIETTMKRKLEGIGTSVGYRLEDPQNAEETSAQIGAYLVRSVMEQKGWDHIDRLVHTSTILTPEIGKMTLDRAGLDPSIPNIAYRTACSGVVTSMVDTLENPQMHNERIVIVSLEPISKYISEDQYNLDEILAPGIFSDDYAAVAYNTNDYEIMAAKTVVRPDGGTIMVKTDYKLPPHNPSLVQDYYSFEGGGKAIISVSEDGVFIHLPKPKGNNPSEMNGKRTAIFFARNTPNVIEDVMRDSSAPNDIQIIMHQPSKPVYLMIKKTAVGMGLTKVPRYILGDIERSNSGSATTLVIWQNLTINGELDPEKPFLLCAPGVGSVTTAAVIKPK